MLRFARRLFSTQITELVKKVARDNGFAITGGLVDPRVTGYLNFNESFEVMCNRGLFLKQVNDVIETRRAKFAAMGMSMNSLGHKNINHTMATIGASGSGKSASVGLLMDLSLALKDGRREAAADYIRKEVGERHGPSLIRNLENAVVVPITFNSRQEYLRGEARPAVSVLSRMAKAIYSGQDDRLKIKDLIWAIESAQIRVTTDHVYALLDDVFKPQESTCYLFCIDEFLLLNDEQVQLEVLSLMSELMDTRSSSFNLITSLDLSTIQARSTTSKRAVKLIQLTSAPDMVLRHDGLRRRLEDPKLGPLLIEATYCPKLIWSIKDLADSGSLVKTLQNTKVEIEGRSVRDFFIEYGKPREDIIEGFTKSVLIGKPLNAKESFGIVNVGNKPVNVTASTLQEHHIFVSVNVAVDYPRADIPPADLVVPISMADKLASVIQLHPAVQQLMPCAGFWALCMARVEPWVLSPLDIRGQGYELMEMLNEVCQRTRHGNQGRVFDCVPERSNVSRYESVFNTPENAPYGSMSVVVHSRYQVAVVDPDSIDSLIRAVGQDLRSSGSVGAFLEGKMCDQNGISSCLGGQFLYFKPNKYNRKTPSLMQLNQKQLEMFANGGVILMNSSHGKGYDYCLVEGGMLTFVECKFSKVRKGQAVHTNAPLSVGEVNKKRVACAEAFEHINRMLPKPIESWRLILKCFKNVPQKELRDGTIVIGPEGCLSAIPPSFTNRLEMSSSDSYIEVLEAHKARQEQYVKRVDDGQ